MDQIRYASKSTWFDQVPKAELHLHLEGAIPHEALWSLIQKYGGDPTTPNLVALKRKFKFRDFPHFLEVWTWKNQFLREYEDFTFIAEAVASDLAQQNIRYVEAYFAPYNFTRRGLEIQKLTEAIRLGLSRVSEIEVALVPDLVRNYGPEQGALTLAEVYEAREFGIVGIGVGGAEHLFPPEPFAAVYEEARRLGFYTSIHAGEAAGAESMWDAIRHLKADRIGHGTRAEEDEALLEYLVKHQIPLEMCPLSNVRTGVVKSIEAHPVRRYFERGIVVTINSDDPKMFGNTLAEEYQLLASKLGFSRDEIRSLILQSIQVSWQSDKQKARLIEAFQTEPVWLEEAS